MEFKMAGDSLIKNLKGCFKTGNILWTFMPAIAMNLLG
jgi:hypothetical protein